jgi:hypothetical protein
MKKVLVLLSLSLSLTTAFAQSISGATTGVTLSPFVTATRMLESTQVGTAISIITTSGLQARGVADKEQLRDELVELDSDMISGLVKTVDEVRQPALKELINEISSDAEQMEKINSAITSGSELHKIATALTITLLGE